MTDSDRAGPGPLRVVTAYAASDSLILWRMRTPLAFLFVLPAVLSVTLGPAIAGADTTAPGGRTLIGIAVLFSFMTVNYAGLAYFREFANGTWMRQAVMRPPRWAFMLGKTLPVAAAGLLQLTVFGLVALLAYHTPLHGSVPQLLLVAIGLTIVGCAIGVVLYGITDTISTFQSLAYIVLITTGCCGGALVPYARLPLVARDIGIVTPQYWALRALDETTTGRGSWGPTGQALAVMAVMVVVLGGLGWRGLDYRRERTTL